MNMFLILTLIGTVIFFYIIANFFKFIRFIFKLGFGAIKYGLIIMLIGYAVIKVTGLNGL